MGDGCSCIVNCDVEEGYSVECVPWISNGPSVIQTLERRARRRRKVVRHTPAGKAVSALSTSKTIPCPLLQR